MPSSRIIELCPQAAIDIDYIEIISPIYKYIDFYKNGLGIIQDFDDM